MRRVKPDELPDNLDKMRILSAASNLERGADTLHQLEDEFRRRNPPDLMWAAQCLCEEGRWLCWSGRNSEAELKLAEAFRILPRGVRPSLDYFVNDCYAMALGAAGKWSNSLAVARSGLSPWRDTSGHLLEPKLLERNSALVSDIVGADCAMRSFDEALSFLRVQERELQAADPTPDVVNYLRTLQVQALARGRRVREALTLMTNLSADENFSRADCVVAGALALGANDLSAYKRWCATAVARFTSGQDGSGAWEIARLLLAQPQSQTMVSVAEELVDRAEYARDYSAARAPGLRGWLEYRKGRYAEALTIFRRQPTDFKSIYGMARAAQSDPLTTDWGFQRAMAALQLGQLEEATNAFRKGLEVLEEPGGPAGKKRIDLGYFCSDWYLQNAARIEAEPLFREKGLPVPRL